MCLCQRGFGHYDCSTCRLFVIFLKEYSLPVFFKIDLGLSCNSDVCLNEGTCEYDNGNVRCICSAGFAGPRCEWGKKKYSIFCLKKLKNNIMLSFDVFNKSLFEWWHL